MTGLTETEKIELAVYRIISDLKDRRGLRHEWDQIDDDIKTEIRKEWIKIVERTLETK